MAVVMCSQCETWIDLDYDVDVFFCETCFKAVCLECCCEYGLDTELDTFLCPDHAKDKAHG